MRGADRVERRDRLRWAPRLRRVSHQPTVPAMRSKGEQFGNKEALQCP